MTALTLLIHGYHPLAEDGGLYVAGVKWLLNPALFSHDTVFVTEHLRFSEFAPWLAAVVRFTHVPLLWVLLAVYVGSVALTLIAGRMILQRSGFSNRAQLGGVALLAAWWTMPVAGTSLMLMDPYVTARSISTPLTLFALAWAMEAPALRPAVLCAGALLSAAVFHPLMAVYGTAFAVGYWLGNRISAWLAVSLAVITLAAAIQFAGHAESPAYRLAVHSRYYWFLAQWQWFERLGIVGPLVVLAMLAWWFHRRRLNSATRLAQATITLGVLATAVALIFAHESYTTHDVARLQPLRCFLEAYALLALLSGAWLVEIVAPRIRVVLATAVIVANAAVFCFVARMTFPQSPQVEWPWRESVTPNAWVQAFLWARANTPPDALFAMDAKYVNTDGEDAQAFRAIAERSAIPDFSKDGGEAAITPALADAWLQAATAQAGLSELGDKERDARLRPLAVNWMLLHASAATEHPCPYRNAVVKICVLPR